MNVQVDASFVSFSYLIIGMSRRLFPGLYAFWQGCSFPMDLGVHKWSSTSVVGLLLLDTSGQAPSSLSHGFLQSVHVLVQAFTKLRAVHAALNEFSDKSWM